MRTLKQSESEATLRRVFFMLLDAATGIELSSGGMLEAGERNYALLRLLSARAGYRQRDNRLPERFHQPLCEGGSANHPIDLEAFRKALEEYDADRGYDDFGPTDVTLKRLGLDECIGTVDRSGARE